MRRPLVNFLPKIDVNNDLMAVYDTDVILQSIYTILVTPKGMRKTQPEFGCNLLTYLFAPVTDATLSNLQSEITAALRRWEPRIKVHSVSVEFDTSGIRQARSILVTIEFSYEDEIYKHTYKISQNEEELAGSIYNIRSAGGSSNATI